MADSIAERGELTQPLAAMGVANRARQRVRGVGGRYAAQGEQALDHLLHLFFSRVAIANDGLFHLQRGVFRDRQLMHDSGTDRRAARLPEQQSRLRVGVDEDLFESDLLGPAFGDHFFQAVEYDLEAQRELAARRSDAAAGDVREPVSCFVENAKAGDAKTWIDAQDARHASI